MLAENGHVIAFTLRTGKDGPDVSFRSVGRNDASTFTGFCAQHDSHIFRLIDTAPFSAKDKEQLFLLAYRSVSHEFHAVVDGAIKIQKGYQWRVSKGLDDPDSASPAGMLATQELITSYQNYRYRTRNFDIPLSKRDFSGITHTTFEISTKTPTIAVSSMFSLNVLKKNEPAWITCILNVFPTSEDKTVVVFSFSKDESSEARKTLRHVLAAPDAKKSYELSKLIITNCSNFVLSPKFFSSWGEDKKNAVTDAFKETMFKRHDIGNSPHFQLFN